MNMKRTIRQMAGIITLAAAAVPAYSVSAPAQDSRALVEVEFLADRDRLAAGEKFRLGLLFRISPGCHIYWMNPGDAGLAPEIEWKLPEGFSAGPLFWPAPQRMEEPGGLLVNVYTGEVMLFCWVQPPESIEGSAVTLKADARWLVCRKICVQESAAAALELKAGPAHSGSPVNEDIFSRYAARVPRPAADLSALRSQARWIGKINERAEARTGLIMLESTAEKSVWLTGEREFFWFGYPSENLTSEEIHYDPVHSSAARLVLHLLVRKPDDISAWPAGWGGVLTARLVKAETDTVDYAVSLDFTGQAE